MTVEAVLNLKAKQEELRKAEIARNDALSALHTDWGFETRKELIDILQALETPKPVSGGRTKYAPLTDENRAVIVKMLQDKVKPAKILAETGVSKANIAKVKKEEGLTDPEKAAKLLAGKSKATAAKKNAAKKTSKEATSK